MPSRMGHRAASPPVAATLATHGRLAPARPAHSRLTLIVALICGWALLYVLTYLPAAGNGSDFQVFYAAAHAGARGIDPYNWPQFWGVERDLYNSSGSASGFQFAPYGNPPGLALLLRPLTALGEPAAYRIWVVLILLAGFAGTYLGLADWPRRPRVAAAALVAISPAMLFDLRLGQNGSFVLLSLGLGLALRAAKMPWLAGAALSIGLLKPHLMLPLIALIALAESGVDRRRLLGGFAVAAAALIGLALLADGGIEAFSRWRSSLGGFAASIRYQPDIASIPGLYYPSAPEALIGPLNVLCLCVAALLIAALAWHYRRSSRPERLIGAGIAVYFALSPYVHTGDQVLLALPILWLIGPQGLGLRDTAVLLACCAAILAPMVVIRDYHTVGINALPPLCLALAYLVGAPRHVAMVVPAPERAAAGQVAHG